MKIAIVTEHYPPAFRGGGPIRSTYAIASLLESAGHDVRVFSKDHDLDGTPMADLGEAPPELTQIAGGSGLHAGIKAVREMRAWAPDVIYLNSLFSPFSSIAPLAARRLRWLTPSLVVLAPRGELKPAALAIKGRKKRMFLVLARRAGLLRGVRVHASSEPEREQMGRSPWLRGNEVVLALQPPAAVPVTKPTPPELQRGVFLSRISRMKNLHTLIRAVLTTSYSLDVYGPFEDVAYEAECRALVPDEHAERIQFLGEVRPAEVPQLMARYKFLALPTFGENFGHAIHEALCVGRPVLIGHDTPFSDVDGSAGLVVDPTSVESVSRAFVALSELEGERYTAYANAALDRARHLHAEQDDQAMQELLIPEWLGR